jgi:hypothetical protein
LTIDQIAAAMPQPASSAPPGVNDTGAVGTPGVYSPHGHTHAGKARKSRVTGVTTATYAWTYPTAFGAGVVPIVNAIVEDPANVASDSYNVEVVGVPTNTGCTFRIIRQSAGLLALLTGALSLNPAPGTVNLHLTAFEP